MLLYTYDLNDFAPLQFLNVSVLIPIVSDVDEIGERLAVCHSLIWHKCLLCQTEGSLWGEALAYEVLISSTLRAEELVRVPEIHSPVNVVKFTEGGL